MPVRALRNMPDYHSFKPDPSGLMLPDGWITVRYFSKEDNYPRVSRFLNF